MKIIADMHTHTLVSGHAYGTIRENARAAADKGLQLLGITDHAPGIPGACDEIYFKTFHFVPRVLYGVKMLYGSEINVLNDGTLSMQEKTLQKLDYGICGIHGNCYTDAGREQNTTNLISCMKHDRIRLVSHPDDDHTPLDYERLVAAAKTYHVALELNNSSLIKKDIRLNCYENYRTMLALCEKLRVPICVDSDAHDPFYVGEFSRAEALLRETGFDPSLVLNADLNRLASFLGVTLPESEMPKMGV